MREHKYRVYRKSTNEYLYLTLNELIENGYSAKDIRGEYIGLKDERNREIYSGDIVDVEDDMYTDGNTRLISQINFKNGCFCLEDINFSEGFRMIYWYDDIKIIGNIYENRELLNKEIK